MVRMFEDPDCDYGLCDGSGIIETLDFTGSTVTRCACRYGRRMPAEVAERLALVVEGEAKARRRAQELMHGVYNREGERR